MRDPDKGTMMNRKTLVLALTLGISIAAIVLWVTSVARGEVSPGVITAQRIVLFDPAGRVRIVLGTNAQTGVAAISVLDPASGKARIVIGTPDDSSSSIELRDTNGNGRAVLALTPSGVRLSLTDVDLKGGVVLGSGADKRTVLVFNDAQPVHRATFGLNAGQDANLAIYDAAGKPTWTAVPAPHQ